MQTEGFPISYRDISLKLDALDYISVAQSLGISSTNLRSMTQCTTEATEFDEITQNKGHAIRPFKVNQGQRF